MHCGTPTTLPDLSRMTYPPSWPCYMPCSFVASCITTFASFGIISLQSISKYMVRRSVFCSPFSRFMHCYLCASTSSTVPPSSRIPPNISISISTSLWAFLRALVLVVCLNVSVSVSRSLSLSSCLLLKVLQHISRFLSRLVRRCFRSPYLRAQTLCDPRPMYICIYICIITYTYTPTPQLTAGGRARTWQQ